MECLRKGSKVIAYVEIPRQKLNHGLPLGPAQSNAKLLLQYQYFKTLVISLKQMNCKEIKEQKGDVG